MKNHQKNHQNCAAKPSIAPFTNMITATQNGNATLNKDGSILATFVAMKPDGGVVNVTNKNASVRNGTGVGDGAPTGPQQDKDNQGSAKSSTPESLTSEESANGSESPTGAGNGANSEKKCPAIAAPTLQQHLLSPISKPFLKANVLER